MPKPSIKELQKLSNTMRKDIIRMLCAAKSGHPGGSLSIIDILTVLYGSVLQHDPKHPDWEDRDRVILSKGHGAPALYAILAHSGYFPVASLITLRQFGSPLQGHPDCRKTPGVEASTGSLGQGLSIAQGSALAAKILKKDYCVFTILSDGECNEGQIWEAAMSSSFMKLDNLIAVADLNRFQLDGSTEEVLNMNPIADKWRAFGWSVKEINGHDFKEIQNAFTWAKAEKGRPSIILANTVKGKGVSFMENNNDFHGVAPTTEEATRALAELEAALK